MSTLGILHYFIDAEHEAAAGHHTESHAPHNQHQSMKRFRKLSVGLDRTQYMLHSYMRYMDSAHDDLRMITVNFSDLLYMEGSVSVKGSRSIVSVGGCRTLGGSSGHPQRCWRAPAQSSGAEGRRSSRRGRGPRGRGC
eukprot:SAG11_NODE_10850_length_801_cov_1.428775_1_plen_137_part_01